MNYRKINFLYIVKFVIIIFFLFSCGYINNLLVDTYETELEKNVRLEEKKLIKNELKKIELLTKYQEKKNKFRDYLHYSFLLVLLGFALITFLNEKIDSENKKLDKFENKT